MTLAIEERKSRDYLLENGFTYIYRVEKQETGITRISLGRGKPKSVEVDVEALPAPTPLLEGKWAIYDVADFMEFTGYEDYLEWGEAMYKTNGLDPAKTLDDAGYLYKVTLLTPLPMVEYTLLEKWTTKEGN